MDPIIHRIAADIKNKDELFDALIDCMPDVCRPSESIVEGNINPGCGNMLIAIGRIAVLVESDEMSAGEAIELTRKLNTCEECPLKTFD